MSLSCRCMGSPEPNPHSLSKMTAHQKILTASVRFSSSGKVRKSTFLRFNPNSQTARMEWEPVRHAKRQSPQAR